VDGGPENRFDHSPTFVRGLDLWVDNFDRHRGQWRGCACRGRTPGSRFRRPGLRPDPPRRHGGAVHRDLVPQFQVVFSENIPAPRRRAAEHRRMDRWILAGASGGVRGDARDCSRASLMSHRARAAQMPAEWYAKSGQPRRQRSARDAWPGDYVCGLSLLTPQSWNSRDRPQRTGQCRACGRRIGRGDGRAADSGVAPTTGAVSHIRTDESASSSRWRRPRRRPARRGPITVRVIAGAAATSSTDSASGHRRLARCGRWT